jgi:hypothetical protein
VVAMPVRRTVDLEPLTRRAAVSSINASARTVDVTWSTGAPVERQDSEGQRYLEVLSLDPAHVHLERLNAGAPLLDSHQAWSVHDLIGAVVQGTARIVGKDALASVRFSAREAVTDIWNDVVDRIIRNVSVGYRVHRFQQTPASKAGGLPTRLATSWTPYELSLVTMGADAGAQVRSKYVDSNRCEIVGDCGCPPKVTPRVPLAAGDADRLRRLQLAKAQAQRWATDRPTAPPSTPSGGPSAEQLRAVGDALELFCGLGKYAAYTRTAVSLPNLTGIEWDSPDLPRDHAAGMTRFSKDGKAQIVLRTDQLPDGIFRTMLHELQHVIDATYILNGRYPELVYEARARQTAERLAGLR